MVFPVPGGPASRTPRFGFQAQFGGQLVVLQGDHDVGFQAADHVLHALQVAQVDGLDLAQVNIAEEPIGTQVVDEPAGVEVFPVTVRLASGLELVGVQFAGEAVNPAEVELSGPLLAEVMPAQGRVILRVELADAGEVAALLDRPGRLLDGRENKLFCRRRPAAGERGEQRRRAGRICG